MTILARNYTGLFITGESNYIHSKVTHLSLELTVISYKIVFIIFMVVRNKCILISKKNLGCLGVVIVSFWLQDCLLSIQSDHKSVCKMVSRYVVVVLLFYVHGKHLRSCWDGQLT